MQRIAAVALLLLAGASWADASVDELRLARYTTTSVAPDPDASNPLAVVATVRFPREHVRTVANAIDFALLRTGYRLDSVDRAAHALLALALPESHRELGPYRALTILELLVGEAYTVDVSPIDRTVAIALRSPAQPSSPAIASTISPDVDRHETKVSPVIAAEPLP